MCLPQVVKLDPACFKLSSFPILYWTFWIMCFHIIIPMTIIWWIFVSPINCKLAPGTATTSVSLTILFQTASTEPCAPYVYLLNAVWQSWLAFQCSVGLLLDGTRFLPMWPVTKGLWLCLPSGLKLIRRGCAFSSLSLPTSWSEGFEGFRWSYKVRRYGSLSHCMEIVMAEK